MKRIMYSLLLGCFAGVVLYIVDVVCFNLLYPSMPGKWFGFMFIGVLVTGVGLTLYTLIIGNSSILYAIFRGILMLVFFTFLLISNGYLGTIRYLQNILCINTNSATDGASGMLSITLFFTVFFTCIVAILIWVCIKRRDTTPE